jgi:ATP-dependent Clp protease ATP-binding subunit ClpC
LTEKVRRRPYSVVLFDEVEKAHPDVMHMMLQLLEEGKLTDSFGRAVDFRNTIVILTSNLGFDSSKKGAGLGFGTTSNDQSYDKLKAALIDEAKRVFKPELLNRFDDMIVFRQLTKDDVSRILDLEMEKVRTRLSAKGKRLCLSRSARTFLIEQGFDPALGARPLRRAIEKFVEEPLSEEILRGTLDKGNLIDVLHVGEVLRFRVRPPAKVTPKKELSKQA